MYPEFTAKLNHIMLYLVHLSMSGIQTPNLVVIGTDSKSNYHTIMTMMALLQIALVSNSLNMTLCFHCFQIDSRSRETNSVQQIPYTTHQ